MGQTAMHLAASLVPKVGAEPFERRGRGHHDAAIPAGLHHQRGQDGQLVVLDGLREQGVKQFGVGTAAKPAQAEVVLTFGGVALPAPFGRRRIRSMAPGSDAELVGHEPHHGSGWAFTGPQRAAGVAQVAEHQRIAEPVMVAAAAQGRGQSLRTAGCSGAPARAARPAGQTAPQAGPHSVAAVAPLMPPAL